MQHIQHMQIKINNTLAFLLLLFFHKSYRQSYQHRSFGRVLVELVKGVDIIFFAPCVERFLGFDEFFDDRLKSLDPVENLLQHFFVSSHNLPFIGCYCLFLQLGKIGATYFPKSFKIAPDSVHCSCNPGCETVDVIQPSYDIQCNIVGRKAVLLYVIRH